jgi:hypothetical protein
MLDFLLAQFIGGDRDSRRVRFGCRVNRNLGSGDAFSLYCSALGTPFNRGWVARSKRRWVARSKKSLDGCTDARN